ncbi:MAG: M28 family peptidase [Thermoleophilia bacterium]|nr:M28 family peptidase [Thermoleophilia bacterium]
MAAFGTGGCGQPSYDSRASQDVAASDHGLLAATETVQFARRAGPRPTGSWGDIEARAFVTLAFQQLGYPTRAQEFLVGDPADHLLSANIIVTKEGTSGTTLVVGAHYDTVPGSQGATDNATGIGLLLEMAGRLREVETPSTIVFVAFGAHWQEAAGASFFVEHLEDFERDALLGMIDLDAVAGGAELVAYGPENGATWLQSALAIAAERSDVTLTEAIAAAGGEHGAFAAAGIPYAGLVSADTVTDGRVDAEQPTAVAGTPRDTVRRLLAGDTGLLERQLGDGARLLEELLTSTLEPPT